MTTRYFSLSSNREFPGSWVLGEVLDARGQELDNPLLFVEGLPVRTEGRLAIPIERPGRALDFTLPSAGFTPVVHQKVADVLTRLAPGDVQFIPVDIDGHSASYQILVATRTVDCVDDRACAKVTRWKPEDGVKSLVGRRRTVEGLKIDPARAGGARLFRCQDWTVALVVSEDIKLALVREGFTGMNLQDITRPKSG